MNCSIELGGHGLNIQLNLLLIEAFIEKCENGTTSVSAPNANNLQLEAVTVNMQNVVPNQTHTAKV